MLTSHTALYLLQYSMNWSRVLYDDLGGRGGGRKPAAGGHPVVAHAIASQRIKRGRIIRTAQSELVVAHQGERDETNSSSALPNETTSAHENALFWRGAIF